MTEFNTIEIEYDGPVGVLRLNKPENLNAMSLTMAEECLAALDVLASRARALIITGAGRAFCSGANLAGGMGQEGSESDFGLSLETHINPMMTRLRDLDIPWITAVRGAAAGVGCSVALAGDMIVASETAYFLQAFSRIGLVPDGGSTHLLARSIGRVRAMEMMLLGERLPAATALEWGLVNRVVPDDMLEAEAMALAQRLANGPASLGRTRRMVWGAIDMPWAEALASERSEQLHAGRSADAAEGIAAFLEKRPAKFQGA
ncbi:enoyl-CoA hydratase-related protein [Sphingosinithalassobacter portus]|uniref:enoyl-CoA hydratase-related protein n=1 Tax=Stakelama portus TaxID=2676234 RepID=UPI001EFD8A6D|nr:enoyl-CoA hydratase-related protein [Sphingosinithalassobacter portus]